MSVNMSSEDMVQVGRYREDQAKEAARVIYGSTGHATRPTSASWTTEGMTMSAVRRTFCLVAVFDVGLIFIIWVIYTQLLHAPSTITHNKWDEFIEQVERYDINHSLFDIVMLSTIRFTLLLLAYALFRINHWWMIAITTFMSCCFLLTKCFLFNFDEEKNPLGYVLLIVSFSMAWVETWFLDFKVLPSEKKARLKALGYGYNNERSPLLRDVESHGSGMEDPRYYSPENSDDEARREFCV